MIMLHRHAARITAKLVEKKLGKKGSVTINKKRLIKKPDLSSLSKDGIEDIVKNEYVVTLGDLVRRRLPYGWSKDLGIGRLEDISQIAAKTLAWSEQRRQLEVKGYLEENSKYFLTFK